jgi:cytochrome c peroxidase
MHDGSIATLAEVLEHYDKGGRAGGTGSLRDRHIRPLGLSAADKQELLAFLLSLTDAQYLLSRP